MLKKFIFSIIFLGTTKAAWAGLSMSSNEGKLTISRIQIGRYVDNGGTSSSINTDGRVTDFSVFILRDNGQKGWAGYAGCPDGTPASEKEFILRISTNGTKLSAGSVDKLYQEFTKAMYTKALIDRLTVQGNQPWSDAPCRIYTDGANYISELTFKPDPS